MFLDITVDTLLILGVIAVLLFFISRHLRPEIRRKKLLQLVIWLLLFAAFCIRIGMRYPS